MKSFNRDGRLRVILKLRSPRLIDESGENREFNAFYERAAEEYVRLAKELPHGDMRDFLPTSVNVDFFIYTEKYMKMHPKLAEKLARSVVIKRETIVKRGSEMRRAEHIDIYNTERRLFVK
jgi:hypothetical protein